MPRLPRRTFLRTLVGLPFLRRLPWTWPPPLPTQGEAVYFLDQSGITLRVSHSPEYTFGFTGFHPAGEVVMGEIFHTADLHPRFKDSPLKVTRLVVEEEG